MNFSLRKSKVDERTMKKIESMLYNHEIGPDGLKVFFKYDIDLQSAIFIERVMDALMLSEEGLISKMKSGEVDLNDEILGLMLDYSIDEDTAIKVQELIDEGVDPDEAIDFVYELMEKGSNN